MSVSVRDALRMAALYVVLSILWLVLSELVLRTLSEDPLALTVGRQINVVLWVLVSAVLIFVSRARLLNFIGIGAQLRSEDRERLRMAAAVFDST
ncbi:MAG TPA: GGDEF domain-containing protein, partial [Pseudomonas sp.]|nr:GGDEF domain-containing protein [Pseudomonas sp.]